MSPSPLSQVAISHGLLNADLVSMSARAGRAVWQATTRLYAHQQVRGEGAGLSMVSDYAWQAMTWLNIGSVYPVRRGIGGGDWGNSIEPWMHVPASINQHRWLRTPDGSAAPCVMCRRMRARCTLRRCTCWRLETDRKPRRCTGELSPHCSLLWQCFDASCRPAASPDGPLTLTFSVPNRRAGLQVEAEAAGGDTHIAPGRV